MVVSTSFWSWLLNVSSVLTSLNYTAMFFWLLICCGNAEGSWSCEFLILDLMFLKYVFFVLTLDAIFCGKIFSFFRAVCG